MGVGVMAGRQRRVAGGRTELVKIKVTPEQLAELKSRAADLGVSVPRLMVDSALSPSGLTIPERHALFADLEPVGRVLAGLGNNINQIAARLNAGERASLGSVIATSAKVFETTGRLNDLLKSLTPPPRVPASTARAETPR
jgi:hypothetical protein